MQASVSGRRLPGERPADVLKPLSSWNPRRSRQPRSKDAQNGEAHASSVSRAPNGGRALPHEPHSMAFVVPARHEQPVAAYISCPSLQQPQPLVSHSIEVSSSNESGSDSENSSGQGRDAPLSLAPAVPTVTTIRPAHARTKLAVHGGPAWAGGFLSAAIPSTTTRHKRGERVIVAARPHGTRAGTGAPAPRDSMDDSMQAEPHAGSSPRSRRKSQQGCCGAFTMDTEQHGKAQLASGAPANQNRSSAGSAWSLPSLHLLLTVLLVPSAIAGAAMALSYGRSIASIARMGAWAGSPMAAWPLAVASSAPAAASMGWSPVPGQSPSGLRSSLKRRPVMHASSSGSGGTTSSQDPEWRPDAHARVLVLLPADGSADSMYGAPWGEVMAHIEQRLEWTDPAFQMISIPETDLTVGAGAASVQQRLVRLASSAQVLLGVGIQHPSLISFLEAQQDVGKLPDVRLFLSKDAGLDAQGQKQGKDTPHSSGSDVGPKLKQLSRLQAWLPMVDNGPIASFLADKLSFTPQAKATTLWRTVQELWKRGSSDDLLFVFLVLINEYVTPVKEVYMTTKGTDFQSLKCMIQNCRQEIMDCVNNPTCKAGLDCLQACSFNDQVCQYRCIVSYETQQFSAFSLCIIQKHNCRSLNAEMPMRPDPAPMATFRGKPITHEAAENMFIAWLSPKETAADGEALPFSWLVAAGKNPAYDYFPCQHQLFYRGKGSAFWYEPIFKVIALNGEAVWRQRRYRVRRGTTPGTFFFSVLDNGVTSNEYWRILDCDDAYDWCLFYYSGAASAAGMSYSGAVLGTKDGSYPSSPAVQARLEAALGRAGIKPWELSYVDNTACAGAPLADAAVRAGIA